jgi:hypothetical protein
MPPVVPPFLIGLIVAPLAKRLLKPVFRGVVKASVGVVMEVKKAAQEAGENIHDLAAEVAAEVVAAQVVGGEVLARSDNAPVRSEGADPSASSGPSPSEVKDDTVGRAEGEAKLHKARATVTAGKAH